MSLTQSASETAPAAGRQASGARRGLFWLVLSGYLLAAVVVTWRLWADPAARVQVGDPHDVDLFAWYLRYAATAISHGEAPRADHDRAEPAAGRQPDVEHLAAAARGCC